MSELVPLLGPGALEVSCDECFEQLDRYVEEELRGGPADARFPGFRTHLLGCPTCAEEHESLRTLLELDDHS